MKKLILLGLLTLALCFGAAAAEETTILGKPFPDFTAVDTQGNTFTLSEQLKTHEAVLINLWATWCPPCKMEMPYLNEVYEAYKDRVAFIALSKEPNDTAEKIDAYIRDNGILFPMGRDENEALYRYCGSRGIPTTVIVDRFGNTGFLRAGTFFSVGEIKRVVEAFLGDSYTETVSLTDIPKDTATRMLPTAETTRIWVENADAKPVIFNIDNGAQTLEAYVIPGETAHLRVDAAAADNPADLIFDDGFQNHYYELLTLLNQERGAFAYDVTMPGADAAEPFSYVGLANPVTGQFLSVVYLIAGEDHVENLAAAIRGEGHEVTWEFGQPVQEASSAAQAYVLLVTDQYGNPVPGLMANFCTDTLCTMTVADENGVIRYEGAQGTYHVQLIMAPAGYSFDPAFEMYVGPAYGEWNLRIKKD